ncbi:MAG: recombinase family protein, partial [Ruminococcus sp.]|nr:recombinase family protein [Ruminococcus sp.]
MKEYCMYLRKSRADVEAEARGEGETLTRHQNMLIELAKTQKLSVVKMYKEIVSGDSIAARPQMQALLADVTKGKYAGVLVVEIERLARGDTIDQGIVAQAFRESSTKIVTPVKTYDPDNEFDEEYFEFSLFMSRREYKTIKRRMQVGRLASVKEGNYISASAPYGYRKINPEPKVHTLEVVPEEAEIIRLIYRLYLDGHGAKFIANELNRMGVSPQKSAFWEPPSIKKILSNPLYCGMLSWKSKSNGDTLYKGIHEPIISEETFNNAQQKKRTSPAAQLRPNEKLQNYYHNILYCKNCGHQLKRRLIASSGHEHMLCVHSECRGKIVSSAIEAVDEA